MSDGRPVPGPAPAPGPELVRGPEAEVGAEPVPAAAGHGPDALLAGLRRHARQLVAELAGPVRRVRLRSGDTELEVEWYGAGSAEAAPGAARPALLPAAPPPTPYPPAVAEAPSRYAVRSPIVGTYYRAPEPGAAPFVAVGDLVRPGQVIGIVEAMKLMNEVTADRGGRVAEVLATDGQPVEYDQPLVTLDPA
ncbi:acetyl-CoA carboxylase biotin carboxyl carrier protein [Micromonospora sp. NPDC047074]|uniref:acetyl-CoA carboxylase biotin carboxyl carrier protein n=1 Tax=Micromonospora sp. NPDC047074 TaxID=3154339 RepID=UPI00340C5E42